MEETQEREMISPDNQMYISGNAMEYRLGNTDKILAEIEKYLKGYYIESIINDQTGEVQYRTVKVGDPLCNEMGVHYIMAFLHSLFNSQYVQGNWTEEFWQYMLSHYRKRLAMNLMINLNNYEIKEHNYHAVIDLVFGVIPGFTSRLKFDRERQSYTNWLRTQEGGRFSTPEPKTNPFNIFAGKKT